MSKVSTTAPVPKSRPTVTVASKLEMDIEIQLCQQKEARVTGQYGSTTETVYVKYGDVYTIRGTSYPVGTVPKGFRKQPELTGSDFALTHGIPADFFEQWLEQNAETEMVKNHLIYCAANSSEAESIGSDFVDVRSGLGPMQPDNDSRSPRPLNSLISPVKTDEDRTKSRAAA